MIDLNVTLEGSLPLETYKYIGKKYHIGLGIDFPNSFLVDEKKVSSEDVIDKTKLALKLLQNPESLELAGYSLVKHLDSLGYVYAEVRVTPLLHTEGGLTQRQIFNCVLRGIYKGLDECPDIIVKVIFCLRRSATIALNRHTVELVNEYKNDVVVGIDLVGSDADRSINAFKPLFMMAKELGLHTCVHPSAKEIGRAIELNIERITLPCPILVSKELLLCLQQRHVLFEVSPIDLLYRQVVNSINEVSFKDFLYYGVQFGFGSVNPTIYQTSIDKICQKLNRECNYEYNDIRQVINSSLTNSFASLEEKAALIKKLSSRFDLFYQSLFD